MPKTVLLADSDFERGPDLDEGYQTHRESGDDSQPAASSWCRLATLTSVTTVIQEYAPGAESCPVRVAHGERQIHRDFGDDSQLGGRPRCQVVSASSAMTVSQEYASGVEPRTVQVAQSTHGVSCDGLKDMEDLRVNLALIKQVWHKTYVNNELIQPGSSHIDVSQKDNENKKLEFIEINEEFLKKTEMKLNKMEPRKRFKIDRNTWRTMKSLLNEECSIRRHEFIDNARKLTNFTLIGEQKKDIVNSRNKIALPLKIHETTRSKFSREPLWIRRDNLVNFTSADCKVKNKTTKDLMDKTIFKLKELVEQMPKSEEILIKKK